MSCCSGGRSILVSRRLAILKYSAAALATVLITCPAAFAGRIDSSNLIVLRATGGPNGNGAQALQGSGVAAKVWLDEYTTAGGLVQSIGVNHTASATVGSQRALTLSGTANTEGTIQLSANKRYLSFGGYNQTATVAGTNGSPSGGTTNTGTPLATPPVERVVGLLSRSGSVDTTTALVDAMSAVNIRSAYTTNGTDIWVTGNGGANVHFFPTINILTNGIHYAQRGVHTGGATLSTQANIAQLTSNNRTILTYEGQMYVSNGSPGTGNTPQRGLINNFTSDNIPTAPGTASGPFLESLPGFATAGGPSPSDFVFFDDNTIYVADTRNDTTNGGIQKWTYNGTTWSLQYTLGAGQLTRVGDPSVFVGVHGLTVTKNALGQAVLYGVTFDGAGANRNKLISVTDTGVASIVATLAESGTNSAFRGVEFAPVPEPGSIVLVVLGMLGATAMRRRK